MARGPEELGGQVTLHLCRSVLSPLTKPHGAQRAQAWGPRAAHRQRLVKVQAGMSAQSTQPPRHSFNACAHPGCTCLAQRALCSSGALTGPQWLLAAGSPPGLTAELL